MTDLNLGVIGNCQISALVDSRAEMVWGCMPQFDADPMFCSLLQHDNSPDPDMRPGTFAVDIANFSHAEQRYVRNTAVLETILHDGKGNAIRITDFAPRYGYLGRMFRPTMLVRGIDVVAGSPRIRIRLNPARDYGAEPCARTRGSNHIRYAGSDVTLRLTTDASITRVLDQSWFMADRSLHLILGPDESMPESPATCFLNNLNATIEYWQNWTRGLSIPFEWQKAVIRAAITLKLCTFEDTGAVIAAITTSIPEAANSGRNWDYRFCWLRDAYFVVEALNRLGATRTMEAFIAYITDLASEFGGEEDLQPVYAISGDADITERTVDTLEGFLGMGPVRVGNQAHEQQQNDVYGAVILAATQNFFDERLAHPAGEQLFERLAVLGERAFELHDKPDAGLWEYRGRQRVHTFSSLMCWAACDRLAKIATHLELADSAAEWQRKADVVHAVICDKAWDGEQQAFTESFGRPELDASLLTMHDLGFIPPEDPRFVSTVDAIGRRLRRGQHLFRYDAADDFGEPENAFNICTFWYIDALAAIGREDEARDMFNNILSCRNSLGLLSEDINPENLTLWGNFPQTYSMAGIINVATRLSKLWHESI